MRCAHPFDFLLSDFEGLDDLVEKGSEIGFFFDVLVEIIHNGFGPRRGVLVIGIEEDGDAFPFFLFLGNVFQNMENPGS